MQAQGTLFLSRCRPIAQRAADGGFALQLRAVDRIGPHQVEPWAVLYSGDTAARFWEQHAAELIPGAAIRVEVLRMRSHVVGRALPEIHAVADSVTLLPPHRAGQQQRPVTEAA